MEDMIWKDRLGSIFSLKDFCPERYILCFYVGLPLEGIPFSGFLSGFLGE